MEWSFIRHGKIYPSRIFCLFHAQNTLFCMLYNGRKRHTHSIVSEGYITCQLIEISWNLNMIICRQKHNLKKCSSSICINLVNSTICKMKVYWPGFEKLHEKLCIIIINLRSRMGQSAQNWHTLIFANAVV